MITSEFPALLIDCSVNMANSKSKIALFDRGKVEWTDNVILKQQSRNNAVNTFTFTTDLDYIIHDTQRGQIHFFVYLGLEKIIPVFNIHKKLQLNDGTSILTSEFKTYVLSNDEIFKNDVNAFNYNEFLQMINLMNWIEYVNYRINSSESQTFEFDDFLIKIHTDHKIGNTIENKNERKKKVMM